MPASLPPILVIDDSKDDLHLLKRLLAKAGVKNPVVTFDEAPDAISFLSAASSSPDAGLMPCLVMTDLKMPGFDGARFIKWIRAQKALSGMMVVMISGSGVERDLNQARAAGADSFFGKFPTAGEMASLVAEASRRRLRGTDRLSDNATRR